MISSVIAYLGTDPLQTIETIEQNPAIEIGKRNGNLLPMVLETPDARSGKELFRWLNDLPEIEHLDVAYVHFDTPSKSENENNHERGSV